MNVFKKLRFDLKALVVFALTSAFVLGANIKEYGPFVTGLHSESVMLATFRGWPLPIAQVQIEVLEQVDENSYHWARGIFGNEQEKILDIKTSKRYQAEFAWGWNQQEVKYQNLLLNFVVGLIICLAAVVFCVTAQSVTASFKKS